MSDVATIEPLLRWLVLSPLLGALLLVTRRPLSGTVWQGIVGAASASVIWLLSVIVSVRLFRLPSAERSLSDSVYGWISSGSLSAEVGFRLDPLSSAVALTLTSIAALVCLAAVGREEKARRRLLLFVHMELVAVLVLLLADNLLLAYLGWVATGLVAALWIASQGVTGARTLAIFAVSDAALLAGALLIFRGLIQGDSGTLAWSGIVAASADGGSVLTPAAYAIVLAAVLRASFLWLPPTAALGTSGLALLGGAIGLTVLVPLARLTELFAQAGEAASWLAWSGALIAVWGAFVGAAQRHLDRALVSFGASHLGLALLSIGCGAPAEGVYHGMSQALFLALLFVAAGSVIRTSGGEDALDSLGGLRHRMPGVHRAFALGALAAGGFPPLVGFASRESLLGAVYASELGSASTLYYFALFSVAVLAFGLARVYFRTFAGESRAVPEVREQQRDPALPVRTALILLSILTLAGGIFASQQGLPGVLLGARVEPLLREATERWLSVSTTALAASGALVAYVVHSSEARPAVPRWLCQVREAISERLYVDRLGGRIAMPVLRAFSRGFLFRAVDRSVLEETFLRGSADAYRGVADEFLKRIHTGRVQSYGLLFAIGALGVVGYLVGLP